MRATITRAGKADIDIERPVSLGPGESRDVTFSPGDYEALRVSHPDPWWPYTMGRPDLYDLRIQLCSTARPPTS